MVIGGDLLMGSQLGELIRSIHSCSSALVLWEAVSGLRKWGVARDLRCYFLGTAISLGKNQNSI